MSDAAAGPLKTTPLNAFHRAHGGKMVPFAGWDMPVQYAGGILSEHRHCRSAAGLFDVSHMAQVRLPGAAAVAALEALVPADVAGLAPDRTRLTVFTDERGGVLDDLMVTRVSPNEGDGLYLVVNAGRADHDLAHLRAKLPASVPVEFRSDLALLALQGPLAVTVLERLAPGISAIPFMGRGTVTIAGIAITAWRLGYTGEDGYELSCASEEAVALAERLCAEPEVALAGLGARDSLRLEAGLNLYGHELSTEISPIEAGLAWTIGKCRRAGGAAAGGFPGADVVLGQLANGAPRRRSGLLVEGRSIAREGTPVLGPDGATVSSVTSGTFSPTLDRSIAMAYLPPALAVPGTALKVSIRGRETAATVTALPFVAHRYAK